MRVERQARQTGDELARMLAAAGLQTEPTHFMELVQQAIVSVLWRRAESDPASSLTEPELAELRAVGLDVGETPHAAYDEAAARSTARLAMLLASSLSVTAVAEALQMSEGRVRQMLNDEHTLYGVKEGRTWRIPAVQLADDRLVRNLRAVVPALPRDLHPLAFFNWFVTPSPALRLEGEPTSPLEWLESAGDPGPVAADAADL